MGVECSRVKLTRVDWPVSCKNAEPISSLLSGYKMRTFLSPGMRCHPYRPFTEVTIYEWERVWSAVSPFCCCAWAAPGMEVGSFVLRQLIG